MADPKEDWLGASTSWSRIGRFHVGDPETKRQILGELVEQYYPALRAYLMRRKGMDEQQAEDVLQSFVQVKLLEYNLIGRAKRERGGFRALLVQSLNNFVVDRRRSDQSKHRSVGATVPLEAMESQPTSSQPDSPDVFDVEFAKQVLSCAGGKMKSQCDRRGQSSIWGVFEARIFGPVVHGTPVADYEEIVERFQFTSYGEASNRLMTAKRIWSKILREVVADYVGDDESEINEEIAELSRQLARNGL